MFFNIFKNKFILNLIILISISCGDLHVARAGTRSSKLIKKLDPTLCEIQLTPGGSKKQVNYLVLRALTSGDGIDIKGKDESQTKRNFSLSTANGKLTLTGLRSGKLVFSENEWGFVTDADNRQLFLLMSTRDRYKRTRHFVYHVEAILGHSRRDYVGVKFRLVHSDQVDLVEVEDASASEMIISEINIDGNPVIEMNWDRPYAGGYTQDEATQHIEFLKDSLKNWGSQKVRN